ncbi:MAG: hypothetical protein KDC99_19470 [Cyclobacteriaceae bacterium]|nr:hypothetical protein [Cyclobacteriaceae bacterium]
MNEFKPTPPSSQLIIDEHGNVFFWVADGKKRFLGTLRGRDFHCQRDPARHVHRKTNSYGFNHELIKGCPFERLIIHLPDGTRIWITRQEILKCGIFLQFKAQGFERQLFVKLKYFRPYDESLASQVYPDSPSGVVSKTVHETA